MKRKLRLDLKFFNWSPPAWPVSPSNLPFPLPLRNKSLPQTLPNIYAEYPEPPLAYSNPAIPRFSL